MTGQRHTTIHTETVTRPDRIGHRYECPACGWRRVFWVCGEPGMDVEEVGDRSALHSGSNGLAGLGISARIVDDDD